MKIQSLLLLILFLFSVHAVPAQETFIVSGTIKASASGEVLIGSSVEIVELKTGGITNDYGFYSLTVPAGTYTFRYGYIGYERIELTLDVSSNIKQDVELTEQRIIIEETIVTGKSDNINVTSPEIGTVQISPKETESVPVLFGEQDVLKTIQLMPGINEVSEGGSGFFVRGGNPDQNLILLDEAPVYNASHLLGFFSVFNSDALNNVKMIKGAAPPEYGGRLSSVLDIKMNEGNNKQYRTSGGLGLISSRLTFQGPIVKNKGSFIISGRRTYADMFLMLAKNKDLKNSRLYFYDLNVKANYKIGDNDRLYVSGYFGRDLLGYKNEFGFDWGNSTGTIRWNHIFSDKHFLNSSLIFSKFDYVISIENPGEEIETTSSIRDVNLKEDFQYFLDSRNIIRYGVNAIYHTFTPGKITATEGSNLNSYKIKNKYAVESAAYIALENKFSDKLTFDFGLRLSSFTSVGPGTTYKYDDKSDVTSEKNYDNNEIINNYSGFEPRLLAKYEIDESESVKLSYARNTQYIHLLSNSTTSTPMDIWHPSTKIVKPQSSDQVSAGYFRNYKANMYETSFEVYYKDMKSQVDYKNGADILLNKHAESELVFGKGWSYGAEYYAKKKLGRLQGWLSYSLSRTRRKFADINDGRAYPSKYDRTHDFSLVGIYQRNAKWTYSFSWVFHTGNAVTFPSGKYSIDDMTINYYTERNGYRMPAYHRLDIGATYFIKRTEESESSLNFSLYNAYGRKNAYSIYFRENEDNPDYTEAVQVSMFTFFPSITYNFRF